MPVTDRDVGSPPDAIAGSYYYYYYYNYYGHPSFCLSELVVVVVVVAVASNGYKRSDESIQRAEVPIGEQCSYRVFRSQAGVIIHCVNDFAMGKSSRSLELGPDEIVELSALPAQGREADECWEKRWKKVLATVSLVVFLLGCLAAAGRNDPAVDRTGEKKLACHLDNVCVFSTWSARNCYSQAPLAMDDNDDIVGGGEELLLGIKCRLFGRNVAPLIDRHTVIDQAVQEALVFVPSLLAYCCSDCFFSKRANSGRLYTAQEAVLLFGQQCCKHHPSSSSSLVGRGSSP
ncbi:hypothetical protein TTRE_0000192301 [Trichuris trichiura]|uniref:Uncharacterized protein n=1 Tax=Trichuris trichiura TaxID=36087 RepID=A0A077Z1X1_TRITR|nr:hypothetical protein TTRE_0000192301 [Trichuris trichiura]